MTQKLNQESTDKNLVPRSPIVVVLGHIDHGKTTLLDFIQKSSVTAKESGGITQHIGAYEAVHGGKSITFIDTPGHEAFSKMRSRGATVADVAILVIAADDGIKPQTKEAIAVIRETSTPYVVAINKIDRNTADIEKVVRELTSEEIYLEGKGGNVPWVGISAKEGTGVDQLLETVLLLAELEELKANPNHLASGVVIESHRDPKRGVASTLLVRDGTLKRGEYVVSGVALAKIRIFENFLGESVDSVGPSSPAVVIGFDKLPSVGVIFQTFFSQKEAVEVQKAASLVSALPAEKKSDLKSDLTEDGEATQSNIEKINIVIKSDTEGSIEAIYHEIEKIIPSEFSIKFLRAAPGDVSEDDIRLASSAPDSVIIAFRVSMGRAEEEMAKSVKVGIKRFSVIYEVADFIKERVASILLENKEPVCVGKAKIIKVFSVTGKGQVVGGKIIEGALKRGCKFVLMRRENKIGEGKVVNLQSNKADVEKVVSPDEFGALVNVSISVVPGDMLDVYES